MKRSKFTNEQILAIVKEGGAGRKVANPPNDRVLARLQAHAANPRASVRAGIPERVAMQMRGRRTRSVFER